MLFMFLIEKLLLKGRTEKKTIFKKFLSPSTYSFGTYIELEMLLELYFCREEFVLIFQLKQILIYNYPKP